jgi:hypothetical protein
MGNKNLTDVILNVLAAEGGSTSLWYLRQALEFEGFRMPSNDQLEGLGLTLKPVHKKGTNARTKGPIVKTIVTI